MLCSISITTSGLPSGLNLHVDMVLRLQRHRGPTCMRSRMSEPEYPAVLSTTCGPITAACPAPQAAGVTARTAQDGQGDSPQASHNAIPACRRQLDMQLTGCQELGISTLSRSASLRSEAMSLLPASTMPLWLSARETSVLRPQPYQTLTVHMSSRYWAPLDFTEITCRLAYPLSAGPSTRHRRIIKTKN